MTLRAARTPALSLPPSTTITFLMPYYYGSPARGETWGPAIFNEFSASVGLLPWILLPASVVAAWSRTGTKFFLAVGALVGSMAYGLPGISALGRIPPLSLGATHRVLPVLVFSACALAAIALDAILENPGQRRRGIRWSVTVAFVALGAYGLAFVITDYPRAGRMALTVPLSLQYLGFLVTLTGTTLILLRCLRDVGGRSLWPIALLGAHVISLLPLAATYNPVIDTRLFYPRAPALGRLRQHDAAEHGRATVIGAWNMAMRYGYAEIAGYDGMTPRLIEEVAGPGSVGSLGNGPLHLTASPESAVFDLLGIRYVLTPPGASSPAPHFSLDYDGGDARVYRNDRALPRAFLAHRVRACVGDAVALRMVRAGEIDFRQEVLIAACEGVEQAGPGRGGRTEIRSYGPRRVELHAVTDAPAYLVLTDTWFPGWQVSVDGVDRRLWRANHAFRAVWLPPGEHTVVFEYRPRSVRIGLVLSGLAVAIVAGLWFVPVRQSRG